MFPFICIHIGFNGQRTQISHLQVINEQTTQLYDFNEETIQNSHLQAFIKGFINKQHVIQINEHTKIKVGVTS